MPSAAIQAEPLRSENELRHQLGVPSDAHKVLVFGESSHWDTNWLKTSEEYFRERIDLIFDGIFAALAHDPRRVYAIESVFFLKLYWERRPLKRELLRELLVSRRLRLLSASLTTPDTLLPGTETILRDYLLGQEWLRQKQLPLEPHISYFPDNFGHSPSLPTLMQALGIDSVGVTRVDGMYFVGSDWRRRSDFPRPGSTAAALEKEHKTLDFIWRAEDGAEVLCHWNAFTYFQGDMLAHAGIIRWNGQTFAIPWRSRGHIARRLKKYACDLGGLSLTPYMYCPIGMDFNAPIADIGALLERYNREVYPETGVYAVMTGLDDYLELVSHHRSKLPTLACDPNPYWMGFYATRPEVKQRPMRVARTLVLTEKLSVCQPKSDTLSMHLQRAWSVLSLSNHHDYITGTSPDRVWREEQSLWLDEAEREAKLAWQQVAPPKSPAVPPAERVKWSRSDDILTVQTPHYTFTLSALRGGCMTSFTDANGRDVLRGLGNDLVVHRDTGGLWRLGHEYLGGSFAPILQASDHRAEVVARDEDGGLHITVTCRLAGELYLRDIYCRADLPFVRMRICGVAKRKWTVCCRFATTLKAKRLWMDTPGGHVDRPTEKIYDPTFWPVQSHCCIDGNEGQRLHVAFDTPGALAFRRDDSVEWIVARNAVKETAFGFLPVLAHPIGGTTPEEQVFDYAIGLEGARDDSALNVHRRALHAEWLPPAEREAFRAAHTLVKSDDPRVIVTVTKHAEDGRGIIVRLRADDRSVKHTRLVSDGLTVRDAFLCDARERIRAPLSILEGVIQVPMQGAIVTVRLM